MSHTPGQWFVRRDPKFPRLYEIVSEEGMPIIDEGFKGSCDVEMANARLMAASPELLFVAHQFLEMIDAMEPVFKITGIDVWENVEIIRDRAQQIVSKATEDKS